MVRAADDTQTLDLLTWEPPRIVERFEESKVRSGSHRDRIARAVAETLRSCSLSREAIAEGMADWLGEEVSRHMLDAYASQGRAEHTISYLRMLALVHVTGDLRLLQLGAELFGSSVVEDRYLPWVEVGQLAANRDEVGKAYESALRQARRETRR